MNAHSVRPASPLVQGRRLPLFHQDLGQDGLRLVVRKNCRPPIQVWVRSRRQAQQVLLRQRSAWNPPNSPNTNQGANVIPDERRIYANAKLKWPSVVLFPGECHFYRGGTVGSGWGKRAEAERFGNAPFICSQCLSR